jgi:F-type H+-transporting ATPase subunit epsilon
MVTPTQILYSDEAEMVVCRTVEGEIAFLADHMPYVGALDPCVVRVVGAGASDGSGSEVRFAARGGFVEVKDNQVIMLADLAIPASEVDIDAARRDEASASQQASGGGEDQQASDFDLRWAQVRIEAAQPQVA